MARTASPWFWEKRQGWYVNKDGQRHFLGAHPEGAPAPRKTKGKWNAPNSVMQAFHTLMADPDPKNVPKTFPRTTGPTVPEIFDKYLDWCQRHRASRTFDWYRDHIQSFLDSLPGAATMPVPDLKPFHVIKWVDKHPDWSPTYRRGAIIALQRPFNWAEELGYVAISPIKKIKKPQAQRRENPVSPENFNAIMAHYSEGDRFHDLLLFAWHSGCRPQEVRQIEARHVRVDAECGVIPREEAKGKRRDRVIHLHGPALEIIKRLLVTRPEGKLFVNEDGRPWKRFAIANRFDRLHLSLGMRKLRELGQIEPVPRFNRRKFADKARSAAQSVKGACGNFLGKVKGRCGVLADKARACCRLARPHTKPLLLAAGVGVAFGVTAYFAGPWFAAGAGWLAGFAATLGVQDAVAFRRLLGLGGTA
jgi:integrase